jgi:hypothetical protein
MTRESKKLIYKHVAGLNGKDTFQDTIAQAIAKYKRPKSRVEPLGTDRSEIRFINMAQSNRKMLVGSFHKLTQGAGQYIIQMADNTVDAWDVTLVKAKQMGELAEFVAGTLFYGIWRNHLIMHQTAACRADQFQDYSRWLIAKLLQADDVGAQVPLIDLVDPVPPDLRRKSAQPVRSVKLGASLETGVAGGGKKGDGKSKTTSTRVHFTPTGAVWDGLMKILHQFNARIPEELLVDNPLGEQDIRVSLELTCSKRKAESTAGEVLGFVGRALSHSDLVEYSVHLADGTKITREEMKVEKTIRVDCAERQPIPQPLFAAMQEWMAELIESKRIIDEDEFGNIR